MERIGQKTMKTWTDECIKVIDKYNNLDSDDKTLDNIKTMITDIVDISGDAIALLAAIVDCYEEIGCKCEKDKSEMLTVKRILKSGDRTIVFWKDGGKTIVKKMDGEEDSDYDAFVAALAKRIYGNNSQIRKLIKNKLEVQESKK